MTKVRPQLDLSAIQSILATELPTPNLIPLVATIPADLLTPWSTYLKISEGQKRSFLYESVSGGERIGRYSFIGAGPFQVIETGEGFGPSVDPVAKLEEVLSKYVQANVPGLPPIAGGAIGYVSYDCIKYFEPKTARPLKDVLGIPEGMFMLFDKVVVFDSLFRVVKIIVLLHIREGDAQYLESKYHEAVSEMQKLADILLSSHIPELHQPPIRLNHMHTSNIGQEGYMRHVRKLKEKIKEGQIIQAVPSQRIARRTDLHPFNVYRHLRTVNPSPYMFYINCDGWQIVGASPELLVKEDQGRIVTHPIAGTVKRGTTMEEDDRLAQQLLDSAKDRAEHVMLLDLARNDINRVCDPLTTTVDRLMTIERFSHVSHLVSQVSGVLRKDKTRFDAFRSIFPAGTVSGAPKVRAMELISELEGEKRGVYAGAVGHWGFDKVSMDTCIAIRTMTFKDGVAYLQAGGGIVFDSDPLEEWEETINKLNANIYTIKQAELRFKSE